MVETPPSPQIRSILLSHDLRSNDESHQGAIEGTEYHRRCLREDSLEYPKTQRPSNALETSDRRVRKRTNRSDHPDPALERTDAHTDPCQATRSRDFSRRGSSEADHRYLGDRYVTIYSPSSLSCGFVFVAYQQLSPSVSPELGNKLLGLFDCCYRHEAFTVEQRHLILQWRGRLSNSLQKLGKIEFKAIHSVSSHPLQPRRSMKTPVRNIKSNSILYHGNNPTSSIPLAQYISEPQNKYSLMDSNTIRRPGKSSTANFPTGSEADENNKNNSRFCPAFTAMVPNSQRGTGAYLAENHHREALSRKPSMYPYVESDPNRAKLCKTLSEPNQIRFHKPSQMNSSPLSSINTHPNNYRMMISTPYSQQQFLNSSPIGKPYVSNDQSDYYGRRTNRLRCVLNLIFLVLRWQMIRIIAHRPRSKIRRISMNSDTVTRSSIPFTTKSPKARCRRTVRDLIWPHSTLICFR